MPEENCTETISKSERTRQAILDAAYNLIIEQGYAATSMRQIAEAPGWRWAASTTTSPPRKTFSRPSSA
jgi:DNA-binding transcriptional regulator YbjK